MCVGGGGGIEKEEETSLKNYLLWGGLKVQGPIGNIPREVNISRRPNLFTSTVGGSFGKVP